MGYRRKRRESIVERWRRQNRQEYANKGVKVVYLNDIEKHKDSITKITPKKKEE